eukprot:6208543-Pleurochrysis_carterae.AAC.1
MNKTARVHKGAAHAFGQSCAYLWLRMSALMRMQRISALHARIFDDIPHSRVQSTRTSVLSGAFTDCMRWKVSQTPHLLGTFSHRPGTKLLLWHQASSVFTKDFDVESVVPNLSTAGFDRNTCRVYHGNLVELVVFRHLHS